MPIYCVQCTVYIPAEVRMDIINPAESDMITKTYNSVEYYNLGADKERTTIRLSSLPKSEDSSVFEELSMLLTKIYPTAFSL